MCTSILFSTFEAWYVHQHSKKFHFPPQWIHLTLSKATFYNGVLAICAGVVSNIAAEWTEWGPVSPFMIAVPCLLMSAFSAMYMWEENDIPTNTAHYSCGSLNAIFRSRNSPLLCLGLIQSLFESVMYTFVFLWTPVLEPLKPPLGIVFSCFMLCIMIGSCIHSFLVARNCTADYSLNISCMLALIAFILSAGAMGMICLYPHYIGQYTLVIFIAFLLYEIAVGMYFPAIGYLRSQIIPEQYRASIANWYRVPMNIFTCISLLWLKDITHIHNELSFDGTVSSLKVFLMCFTLLFAAIMFCKLLKRDNENVKLITESV
jgi:hypothetical protein